MRDLKHSQPLVRRVLPRPSAGRWQRLLAASFAAHALLLLAILALAAPRPILPAPENVPVEVWSAGQMEEWLRAAEASAGDPSLATPPPKPAMPSGKPLLTRATTLLSGAVLADPRSRDMRAALTTFETETRMEQICGIEAMAQIAASGRFQPDRVVAYATAEIERADAALTATGAAFRSAFKWYRLTFTCRLSADLQRVEEFAHAIGTSIPRSRWEDYGLPAFF